MQTPLEYRVCLSQRGCVTHVNGEWLGKGPLSADRRDDELLQSCPKEWEYLEQAGREGWDLVSVVAHSRVKNEEPGFVDYFVGDATSKATYHYFDKLYLKRVRSH